MLRVSVFIFCLFCLGAINQAQAGQPVNVCDKFYNSSAYDQLIEGWYRLGASQLAEYAKREKLLVENLNALCKQELAAAQKKKQTEQDKKQTLQELTDYLRQPPMSAREK